MFVAFLMFWARFTYPRLREDQLQAFAWKFLLPLALLNLLIVATEKVIWTQEELGDGIVFLFAPINIVAAAVLVYAWAKVNGYRPENTPKKPRMVKDATGYIPASGGGR